jgi:hypothetical protein
MLRIKIQEELEMPHQQKVQQLEGEIEAQRQALNQLRTERVWLKAELDKCKHERGIEAEEAKQTFDSTVAGYRKELLELETEV